MDYIRHLGVIVDNIEILGDRLIDDEFVDEDLPGHGTMRTSDGEVIESFGGSMFTPSSKRRVRGFSMEFDIKQSIDSKENTADVKIYNLGAKTRGMLSGRKVDDGFVNGPQGIYINPFIKTGSFEVQAGYSRDIKPGIVFLGSYQRIWHEKSEADWITTISATDGHQAREAIINESFDPEQELGEIITEASKFITKDLEEASKMMEKREWGKLVPFVRARIASGPMKDELDKLAKSFGFDWSIINGTMLVLKPEEVLPDIVVLLNEDSGLIGSPEPEYINRAKEQSFVKARSLMNCKLIPGRAVQLDSRDYNGVYKVITVRHKGSSFDNSYYSDVVLMAVPNVRINNDIPLYAPSATPVRYGVMKPDNVFNMGVAGTGTTATGYVEGEPVEIELFDLGDGHRAESSTATAFTLMKTAAMADGINLTLSDSWRSMEEQTQIFNERLDAKVRAEKGVAARPGFSTHQSGRALDINTGLTVTAFRNGRRSDVYNWLVNNAHKFGFFRTVPSEPWHWEKDLTTIPDVPTNLGFMLARATTGATSVSEAGRDFIIGYEKLELEMYRDAAGHPTIGYGHKLTRVDFEDGLDQRKITLDEAIQLLFNDLLIVQAGIARHIKVPLTQGQYDAVASLMFNSGVYKISKSTLVKLLNENRMEEASLQFKEWAKGRTKDGLVVLKGLAERRQKEQLMFAGVV